MWIDLTNSQVHKSHNSIRKARPNVSFPDVMTEDAIASAGFAPVTQIAPPTYNNTTHTLAEGAPIQVEGVWTQQWVLTALSAEDAATELTKARKARWREVKTLRDEKIRDGGIPYESEWYPSTAEAKAAILWVITIGSNTGQRIELLDGSMANLNVVRANGLLNAGATQSAAIAAHADTLKTTIDASTDPATVDIMAGWPAVYMP